MYETMRIVLEWLPAAGWSRLAIDAIWQTTVVGVVALLVLLLAQRRPALRSWVAVLALQLCLIAPLLSAAVRSYGLGILDLRRAESAQQVVTSEPPQLMDTNPSTRSHSRGMVVHRIPQPLRVASSVNDQFATHSTVARIDDRPLQSLMNTGGVEALVTTWYVLWGMASLTLAWRLLLSMYKLAKLRKSAIACDNALIVSAVRRSSQRLGLRRPPPVAVSRSVTTPTVLAFPSAQLIVPAGQEDSCSGQQWEAVFCHELAHVLRRDGWVRLLAELSKILLPWQPLVWRLSRIHQRAAEEASDDWAVAAGSDPVAYADVLARWAAGCAPSLAMGMSRTATGVRARIERLLAAESLPEPRLGLRQTTSWGVLAITLAAVLSVIQLAGPTSRFAHGALEDGAHAFNSNGFLNSWDGRIRKFDVLRISVMGTLPDQPIRGDLVVQFDGEVVLGPAYGSVPVEGMTRKEATEAITQHLRKELVEPKVAVSVIPTTNPATRQRPGPLKAARESKASLVVLVTNADEIVIGGQAWPIEEFPKALSLSRQVLTTSGRSLADTEIILTADANTTAATLQSVLEECRKSGFDSIMLKVADSVSSLDAEQAGDASWPLTSIPIEPNPQRLDDGSNRVVVPSVSRSRDIGKKTLSHDARKPFRPPFPVYVIEPPDVLVISSIKLVPKSPYRISTMDILQIVVHGTPPDQPITGSFQVDPDGNVSLGPGYDRVNIEGNTVDEATDRIRAILLKTLTHPEVSVTLLQASGQQTIAGEHLVGPDGTVNLGIHGSVYVAGMSIADARQAVERHLHKWYQDPVVSIDVFAYNSKVYYVVLQNDKDELGDRLLRFPITGNDTVLDVISQVAQAKDLRRVSVRRVWISRLSLDGDGADQILSVDVDGIFRGSSTSTNYQILPGDRVFISEVGATPRSSIESAK